MRTVSFRGPAVALAAALLLAAAASAYASNTAIADTARVAQAVERGAILWDTRGTDEFRRGHIPGAVNIDDPGRMLRDPNTEDYIAHDRIAKILGGAGIDPAKEIVVYGNKGDAVAYFALLTLQYFGAKNAAVYHGGIDDWRAAGRPVATEPRLRPAVEAKLVPDPGLLVSTQEVLRSLKDPAVQIVDARTPKEYGGEDIRALRGGHIPGAVNIPYEQNWVDPDTGAKLAKRQVSTRDGQALKPREELKALYSKLDPEKETIVYCQSGVRAAETATVLKDLGFRNVKVYDSSWLAWGNQLDAPAHNATFFNVGALNARLGAMQRRIEQLEQELAQARATPPTSQQGRADCGGKPC